MSRQLAASTSQLSIPKFADASTIASLFSLSSSWTAPMPSQSSISALTVPTNVQDSTTAWLMENWNVSSSSLSNTQFVQDPFGSGQVEGEKEELVLSVNYPKGTREGSQFFSTPMRAESNVQTAVLQYEVAFDEEFSFVKGGKLPGLYGSEKGAESICSGGNRQSSCFSARLMWRSKGEGEVYAYIPTYEGFCRQSDVDCNDVYGISLSRGSFDFSAGGWTTITQLISLNTPPFANGLLYLWANNTLALAHTGLVWRTNEDVTLSKIMFSTFFGGSDSSWDSEGGNSYFRNFQVYAGQSPSNTTGPPVNATLSTTSSASSPPSSSKFALFALSLSLLSSLLAVV